MKKRSGFVYLWFDRKHKKYYVGSHFGSENDGYLCSSTHMKRAYKRRPFDFKRRILKRLEMVEYKTLLDEELRYLSMIKENEIGKRYYNLVLKTGHWASKDNAKTVGEKISAAHKNHPDWGHWSRGKVLSDDTKDKIRQANKRQFENEDQRESRRIKSKELWNDPDYRLKTTNAHKGKVRSKETLQKCRESMMGKNVGKKRINREDGTYFMMPK